jgi:hypothetical protein
MRFGDNEFNINYILTLLLTPEVSRFFFRNRTIPAPAKLKRIRSLIRRMPDEYMRYLISTVPEFNSAYRQYIRVGENNIDNFIYFLYLQYE